MLPEHVVEVRQGIPEPGQWYYGDKQIWQCRWWIPPDPVSIIEPEPGYRFTYDITVDQYRCSPVLEPVTEATPPG